MSLLMTLSLPALIFLTNFWFRKLFSPWGQGDKVFYNFSFYFFICLKYDISRTFSLFIEI